MAGGGVRLPCWWHGWSHQQAHLIIIIDLTRAHTNILSLSESGRTHLCLGKGCINVSSFFTGQMPHDGLFDLSILPYVCLLVLLIVLYFHSLSVKIIITTTTIIFHLSPASEINTLNQYQRLWPYICPDRHTWCRSANYN